MNTVDLARSAPIDAKCLQLRNRSGGHHICADSALDFGAADVPHYIA